jgi:8-oxo-dGTP pyrophosphatase MutT (NUDIX family)
MYGTNEHVSRIHDSLARAGNICHYGACERRAGAYDWQVARDDDGFRDSRERLSSALAAALAAADDEDDYERAYWRASELVDMLSAATTASGRLRARAADRMKQAEGLSLAKLGERLGVSKARANDMVRGSEARQPEPPPVVAAVVTSKLGFLAGRRNDATPPWTFIAGQMLPGETPADTVVREVREETGLDVEPGRVIGRRVHPATGRIMIYLTARPAGSTDAVVGDENELAEVRWLSLAEADELLPGMYAPARAYLSRALRSPYLG